MPFHILWQLFRSDDKKLLSRGGEALEQYLCKLVQSFKEQFDKTE